MRGADGQAAQVPGNYPLETRSAELERLRVQGDAMAPDTEALLDLIGVAPGWRCIDIGCGPRGITDLLSRRVGKHGLVVGLDKNEVFLAHARARAAENTDFQLGDIYQTRLPDNSFDLVHMRFVASTAGGPERLIDEATRIARPGGTIVLQEPDGSTLNCWPPHRSWDRLKTALLGAFRGVGADLELARRLYACVRGKPLEDVNYRTFLVAVRSQDPMVDYLPSTIESLRATVVRLGLIPESELDGVLAECRAHLARPDASFTMYTVAQVWGRKPGARCADERA